MSDGSKMQCEFAKATLNLAKNDEKLSTFEPMAFRNNTMPFSQNLPKDGPVFSQIDIIIGGDIVSEEFFFLGNRDFKLVTLYNGEVIFILIFRGLVIQ